MGESNVETTYQDDAPSTHGLPVRQIPIAGPNSFFFHIFHFGFCFLTANLASRVARLAAGEKESILL